ncbi:hypothetical protein [Brevibacillus panacihumi]|uniref:hypothetical protein n=1 Tax=Brevibacillus panacihumi TaxID=497735 RepID=UPI001605B26F|nr:hypothetical protein [Brevibacillus panacihumi]
MAQGIFHRKSALIDGLFLLANRRPYAGDRTAQDRAKPFFRLAGSTGVLPSQFA